MASLADILDEALGSSDEGDVEKRIEEALACPCVADLRDGPCGAPFTGAFSCYVRSGEEVKGSDCVGAFRAFQDCLAAHPAHAEAIFADAEAVADAREAEEGAAAEEEEGTAAAAAGEARRPPPTPPR